MVDDIGTVFRDFNNINDPASGEYEPEKPRIRSLLRSIRNNSGLAVTRNTLAALTAVTPLTEDYMGIVLDDPDPSNNGYYSRVAAAWVWERGFPDTFARVALGGTADAQTGSVAAGVDPASTEVFFATVGTDNTGPMTLSIDGETARDVVNAAGNALSAGEWTGTVLFFLNDDDDYQLLFDAGAVASAAASASAAAADALRAENAADIAVGATPTVFSPNVAAMAALDPGDHEYAYLSEEGRAGQFAFDASDLSAEVSADPINTFYIAPSSDPTGASGAYRRLVRAPAQPSWGGVLSDGSDSAANFQNFLDALDPNTDVDLGGRDYTIGTALVVSTSGLTFRNGTIRADASLGDTNRLVRVLGSLDTGRALTSNYQRGSLTMTIGSTAGLAKGMVCRISVTEKWGRPSSGDIYCSELFMIRAVNSGTQLQLYGSLTQDYLTASSATIEPLLSVDDVKFEGVRLIGKGSAAGNYGIETVAAKNFNFTDGEIWECASRGVQIVTSWNAKVLRNVIEIDGGTSMYGGAASEGSRHVEFSHNLIPRCRHGFATSGEYVNRDLDVCYNRILGATNAGLDAHASAANANYSFNRIVVEGSDGTSDGIVFQGANLRAEGNEISGEVRVGIYHQCLAYEVTDGLDNASIIQGNRILANTLATGVQVETDASPQVGSTTKAFNAVHVEGNILSAQANPTGYGVNVFASGASISGMVTVANNKIRKFLSHGIWIHTTGALTLQNYAVANNAVFGPSSGVTGNGVQLTGGAANGVRYGTITGNTIRNVVDGISETDARDATVTGNTINAYSGTAINMSGSTNSLGTNRVV